MHKSGSVSVCVNFGKDGDEESDGSDTEDGPDDDCADQHRIDNNKIY